MTPNIIYSAEVDAARAAGTPLVALESTIITHGMPWPQNVDTARTVEAEVRANGATPATMAVIDGDLHVGLTEVQLVALAKASNVTKLSRADLAACIATAAVTRSHQTTTHCPSTSPPHVAHSRVGRRVRRSQALMHP